MNSAAVVNTIFHSDHTDPMHSCLSFCFSIRLSIIESNVSFPSLSVPVFTIFPAYSLENFEILSLIKAPSSCRLRAFSLVMLDYFSNHSEEKPDLSSILEHFLSVFVQELFTHRRHMRVFTCGTNFICNITLPMSSDSWLFQFFVICHSSAHF